MQRRMKEFHLSEERVNEILNFSPTGSISTIGYDGYPYTVAVHYVYLNGNIYFHGLPKGEKLDNIKREPKVCFYIYDFKKILKDGIVSPCKADCQYESVCVRGQAFIVHDINEKQSALNAIVEKYTPQFSGFNIPKEMLNGTCVVKIVIDSVTGKYHQ